MYVYISTVLCVAVWYIHKSCGYTHVRSYVAMCVHILQMNAESETCIHTYIHLLSILVLNYMFSNLHTTKH